MDINSLFISHCVFSISRWKKGVAEPGLIGNADHRGGSIGPTLTLTLTQSQRGGALMPRRRRCRGVGATTHTISPLRHLPHRGVVDPPRTTTLRLSAAATVRTVLSSRIPRLPISFTPHFPRTSSSLPCDLTFAPHRPFLFILLSSFLPMSPSILLFVFSRVMQTSRVSECSSFFSLYRELSMNDTALTATGGCEEDARSSIRILSILTPPII